MATSPKLEGYCGIVNGNNSCYMNSIIQLLWSINEFKEMILNLDLTSLDDATKLKLESLNTLFLKMNESIKNGTVLNKQAEYEQLLLLSLDLTHGTQEDARTFLGALLDRIQEANIPDTSEFIKHIAIEKLYNNQSDGKDPILIFPIIGGSIQTSIDDAYEITTNRGVKRELTYLSDPLLKYCIIALNRFDENSNKITKPVTPNTSITLRINGNPIEFRIKGCVRHIGKELQSGHYIYQTYNGGSIEKILNDEVVIDPTEEDIQKTDEEGYIYLYERVDMSSGSNSGKKTMSNAMEQIKALNKRSNERKAKDAAEIKQRYDEDAAKITQRNYEDAMKVKEDAIAAATKEEEEEAKKAKDYYDTVAGPKANAILAETKQRNYEDAMKVKENKIAAAFSEQSSSVPSSPTDTPQQRILKTLEEMTKILQAMKTPGPAKGGMRKKGYKTKKAKAIKGKKTRKNKKQH